MKDLVREAEDRQCDYAVRVVLTTLSPKALHNHSPSASGKFLRMIAYQIWTRHESTTSGTGTGRHHVMVAEATCSDPNSVIYYFANYFPIWRNLLISMWSSTVCTSRYAFNDTSFSSSTMTSTDLPKLIHYSKDYLSYPNIELAIIYQPRLSFCNDICVGLVGQNETELKPVCLNLANSVKDYSMTNKSLKFQTLANRFR